MNDFRDFALIRTNELFVTRIGWLYPYYELTDGQFVYGRLSNSGTFKRNVRIDTADGFWTLKRSGWFIRVMNLNKNEDEHIGTVTPEIWKSKILLKIDEGFEAEFVRKKIFSLSHTWDAGPYGELLHIKLRPFLFKTPYLVTLGKDFQNSAEAGIPTMPLLALLGLSIIIHRQRHATAAGA